MDDDLDPDFSPASAVESEVHGKPHFEHPDTEVDQDELEERDLRQWEPGVDAFVIADDRHTGFCSWFWGLFWAKCKSSTCLVAGDRYWFEYRIDPAFERPIIGQPRDSIAIDPLRKYGQGGEGRPVVRVEVGEWNSYAKERWLCRFGGAGAGVFAWVVSHGGLFQATPEPLAPLWLFVLGGGLIGHEIGLRFEWRIRGPLDYEKFRVQRRCWWAFCSGLWMKHLKKLEKGSA